VQTSRTIHIFVGSPFSDLRNSLNLQTMKICLPLCLLSRKSNQPGLHYSFGLIV